MHTQFGLENPLGKVYLGRPFGSWIVGKQIVTAGGGSCPMADSALLTQLIIDM
jgi:hypothetical protein